MNGYLHSILGMSNDMLVAYALSLGKQMNDSSKIYKGLIDLDFP